MFRRANFSCLSRRLFFKKGTGSAATALQENRRSATFSPDGAPPTLWTPDRVQRLPGERETAVGPTAFLGEFAVGKEGQLTLPRDPEAEKTDAPSGTDADRPKALPVKRVKKLPKKSVKKQSSGSRKGSKKSVKTNNARNKRSGKKKILKRKYAKIAQKRGKTVKRKIRKPEASKRCFVKKQATRKGEKLMFACKKTRRINKKKRGIRR